ncbi:efflux RND transporter periplasmic adaptor subunit [Candidatus Villigracilis saccharophilus]|uniref:efflux RND transporter periplasmic adaptor subunit n=1 Tax=Candidatus Villigracilis saccharophilus TaxID=3140684 RepID=UPI003135525C|nr:efflux RND transporter periplasmic adaptor subunit [Anaerolineales bacterium]
MKQFFSKFSRTAWIIIGVLVVAGLAAFIYSSTRGETVSTFQTAKAERGNLVATVGATGSVRARQSAVLVWQTTGIVDAVNVDVGSRVTRDDVLASLSKASLNQSIILAEADLSSAKKALDDLLNSDTARAQALIAVRNAEKAYEKAYNWRIQLNGKIDNKDYVWVNGILKVREYKGYASAETIAKADEDLALAEAKLNDARRNYERLNSGTDPAEVAAAEARIAAAQSTLNMAYLITPFDGTVTQAEPAVGDQVTTGAVAFRVDDLSHLLVDVQVSEVDINTLSIGQAATLTFDAILGKEYKGEIVEVGQAGDNVQGVVNFTVTIELTDADELVKPGMTAAVNIVVQEVKDVILVPNRSVRLVDAERVVFVLVNGVPTQVKVQLGASSDTMSVLVGGDLKEGDEIILNPPSISGSPFGG